MKTEPALLFAKTNIDKIRTCARWNMFSGDPISSIELGTELVQVARSLALVAEHRHESQWSSPGPVLSAADLKAMASNEWIRYASAENQWSSPALLEALTHDTNFYVQVRAQRTIAGLRPGHSRLSGDQGRI